MLTRWLGYETVVLDSPLPRDECVRRLREAVENELPAHARVVGRVDDSSLRLRKRLIAARNSFQTCLTATIEDEGGSTRLFCRFGPHGFVVVFMLFWFLAVLGFCAAALTFA